MSDQAKTILEKVLHEEIGVDEGIDELSELLKNASPDSVSYCTPFYRTLMSIRQKSEMDFCGNLRQCLLYSPGSLQVGQIVRAVLKRNENIFGFDIGSGGYIGIKASILKDYSDLDFNYRFCNRKTSDYSMADGALYRAFGYTDYLSVAQKLMLYAIKNMKDDESLLACLPTGGGKSLAWELPVLTDRFPGMAIVVVPTVSLAQDHEISSLAAFKSRDDKPVSYYGDMKDADRARILSEIRSGSVPILYISPEALLGKKFQEAVMEAAENGYVGMLVIDEAHLIAQWGIRFRPEFQLLTSFRNKLQKASVNGLRTILLSATLNDADTEAIKKVFHCDNFTEYRADELRPEPEFYLHVCKSAQERFSILPRVIAAAPKPIILYAAIPEQAQTYYDALYETGYRRIGIYTGETDSKDRKTLVDGWRNNEIDIMIATSAFGMGVDKADVRTVITAYTPENISRFYQEVGRAGRDGKSSLNIWLPYPEEDNKIVNNLTKSAIVTCDTIGERWESMIAQSKRAGSDTVWVDIDTTPIYLTGEFTGGQSRGWNKHVIMFLLRAGLIDVLDIEKENDKNYKILIKLLNIPVLEDKEALKLYTAPYRDVERQQVSNSINSVKNMIKNAEYNCFSDAMSEEFPYSAVQCSGCPYCRSKGLYSLQAKIRIRTMLSKEKLYDSIAVRGDDLLSNALNGGKKSIQITSAGFLGEDETIEFIRKLILKGINIIVVPDAVDKQKLLHKVRPIKETNYLLLSFEEISNLDLSLLNGICAVFVNDARGGRELIAFSKRYLAADRSNKIVISAPVDFENEMRHKLLSETVDACVPFGAIL